MLLIDALYVNEGGGKVLLDYLINQLEATDSKIFYLFDNRIKNLPPIKATNHTLHLKPSLWERYLFYRRHKTSFTKVFCMGNLPPNIRLKSEVITYYHSFFYLNNHDNISTKERIKYALKRQVFRVFTTNSDMWLVQTMLIKDKLAKKFEISSSKIDIMPFFPPLNTLNSSKTNVSREKNTLLYVSNATFQKNHIRLIDAFCAFYDQHKKGKLTLTVSQDYQDVYTLIEDRIALGYPINNVGFISRNDLQLLYLSSEFLIFPSLDESLGLGLIEAIDNGCKVIGADLEYTYAVCEPSIVFNPNRVESITEAIISATKTSVENSKSLIENNITHLIKELCLTQSN